MSEEFRTKPNPGQPDRCPSIDPYDTLQCTRRIHEDDQCHCGGIAWRKGTPRYIDDAEKITNATALIEKWRQRAELQGRGYTMVAAFYDRRADELAEALHLAAPASSSPEPTPGEGER